MRLRRQASLVLHRRYTPVCRPVLWRMVEECYMARFALTMVVITALPFAAAVAQTGVELEPATGAAVEAVPAPEPVAAPVEVVPPSPAATAPGVAPIETAPVDPDPVKPPAASLAAPL